MLKADGFDDAILGVVDRIGSDGPILCYSRERVIEILKARDGMTDEEAVEFFEFNIAGAYVGPGTPCFLSPYDSDELDE
jgi:hypothetical protein